MPALYDYQRTGARWLASRRRAYLADVMGLGKTRTVCEGARLLWAQNPALPLRALVLCPSSAVARWETEWAEFGAPGVALVVKSYDAFLRDQGQHIPTLLVLDEVHRLKSATAKRTHKILGREGLFRRAECVWVLSGTPMPNHRPDELFTVLATLWPERLQAIHLRSYGQFVDHFCETQIVWYKRGRQHRSKQVVVKGVKRPEQFKALLTGGDDPLMLRRTWESPEVLGEMERMPPLLWRYELVNAPVEFTPEETRVADVLWQGAAPADLTDSAVLRSLRGKVGLAKVRVVIDLLKEDLETDPTCKRVLFAYHHEVLDFVERYLKSYGVQRLDGRSNAQARAYAVETFQTNPAQRIFLGQTDACKESLTLTAANQVEIIEPSFVPGDDEQACARIRRHGQTARTIVARVWGLAHSYDGRIARIRAEKLQMRAEVAL